MKESVPGARRLPALAAAIITALILALAAAMTLATATGAPAATPGVPTLEDLADYQPATHCSPRAKPGTTILAHFVVQRFGGSFGSISRPCGPGTSEHEEGRAFDWTLSVRDPRDRRAARSFLRWAFAADGRGDVAVKARRMGIMYVIWDDTMYAAWDAFEPRPYLSSECPSRRKCSPTLRHRDHLHISLTRQGGRAETSWYAGRSPRRPADS